jgi:hypothetical protein
MDEDERNQALCVDSREVQPAISPRIMIHSIPARRKHCRPSTNPYLAYLVALPENLAAF